MKEVGFEPVERPIINDTYRSKYNGSPYLTQMIGARARSDSENRGHEANHAD
jgi:hypothetical protein